MNAFSINKTTTEHKHTHYPSNWFKIKVWSFHSTSQCIYIKSLNRIPTLSRAKSIAVALHKRKTYQIGAWRFAGRRSIEARTSDVTTEAHRRSRTRRQQRRRQTIRNCSQSIGYLKRRRLKRKMLEQNYYLLLEGRALLLAPSPFCFPILVYWTRYSKRRSIKNIDSASCRAREGREFTFSFEPWKEQTGGNCAQLTD